VDTSVGAAAAVATSPEAAVVVAATSPEAAAVAAATTGAAAAAAAGVDIPAEAQPHPLATGDTTKAAVLPTIIPYIF
jgi:hypothetical protein